MRDLLLVLLSVSTGAVDAVSWLGLDKVFSAFMTGNVVFLGFRAGGAAGPSVPRVLTSLCAFAVGAFLCGFLVGRLRDPRPVWSPRVTLALGVGLLLQAIFLVSWLTVDGRPSAAAGDVLIGLPALAMGIQSAAIAALGLRDVLTTAVTATVAVFFGDLSAWTQSRGERGRLAAVAVGVFAGAALGAVLFDHSREWAPALPLGLSALAIAIAATTFGMNLAPRSRSS